MVRADQLQRVAPQCAGQSKKATIVDGTLRGMWGHVLLFLSKIQTRFVYSWFRADCTSFLHLRSLCSSSQSFRENLHVAMISLTLPFLAAAIFAFLLFSYTSTAFQRDLRTLLGPFLARFSGLYRLSLVFKGQAPRQYRELHKKYGPIVRTVPNQVSVSDTSMIPTIYGIGSKFTKVLNHPFRTCTFSNQKIDTFLHRHGAILQRRTS